MKLSLLGDTGAIHVRRALAAHTAHLAQTALTRHVLGEAVDAPDHDYGNPTTIPRALRCHIIESAVLDVLADRHCPDEDSAVAQALHIAVASLTQTPHSLTASSPPPEVTDLHTKLSDMSLREAYRHVSLLEMAVCDGGWGLVAPLVAFVLLHTRGGTLAGMRYAVQRKLHPGILWLLTLLSPAECAGLPLDTWITSMPEDASWRLYKEFSAFQNCPTLETAKTVRQAAETEGACDDVTAAVSMILLAKTDACWDRDTVHGWPVTAAVAINFDALGNVDPLHLFPFHGWAIVRPLGEVLRARREWRANSFRATLRLWIDSWQDESGPFEKVVGGSANEKEAARAHISQLCAQVSANTPSRWRVEIEFAATLLALTVDLVAGQRGTWRQLAALMKGELSTHTAHAALSTLTAGLDSARFPYADAQLRRAISHFGGAPAAAAATAPSTPAAVAAVSSAAVEVDSDEETQQPASSARSSSVAESDESSSTTAAPPSCRASSASHASFFSSDTSKKAYHTRFRKKGCAIKQEPTSPETAVQGIRGRATVKVEPVSPRPVVQETRGGVEVKLEPHSARSGDARLTRASSPRTRRKNRKMKLWQNAASDPKWLRDLRLLSPKTAWSNWAMIAWALAVDADPPSDREYRLSELLCDVL